MYWHFGHFIGCRRRCAGRRGAAAPAQASAQAQRAASSSWRWIAARSSSASRRERIAWPIASSARERIAQPAVFVQAARSREPRPRTPTAPATALRRTAVARRDARPSSGSQSGRVNRDPRDHAGDARPASTPVAIHADARRRRLSVGARRHRERGSARGRRTDARGPHARRLEAVRAARAARALLRCRAALDRRRQQRARGAGIAAIERRGAGVQQLFAFALALGDRAARALDVRLGPRMAAIEEQDARPDADGELVLSGEVVIEAGEEELFDARVALALRHFSRFGGGDRSEAGRSSKVVQAEASSERLWNRGHGRRQTKTPTARRVDRTPVLQRCRMPIIESIPNVSEGRRPDVIERLADADPRDARRPPARLLVRRVAQPIGLHARRRRRRAQGRDARALRRRRRRRSTCARTSGEHPRLGAVDVVPFVRSRA